MSYLHRVLNQANPFRRVLGSSLECCQAENKRLRELYENAVGNRKRFGWTINHLLECEESLRVAEEHHAEAVEEIAAWLQHIDRLDEIPGARSALPEHNVLWNAAQAIRQHFGEQ